MEEGDAVASQFSAQDEYAIYKKALESGDPRQQIKLLDELLKRNSDTAYLPQALVVYLNAYRALGDSGNGMLTAEKILKIDPKKRGCATDGGGRLSAARFGYREGARLFGAAHRSHGREKEARHCAARRLGKEEKFLCRHGALDDREHLHQSKTFWASRLGIARRADDAAAQRSIRRIHPLLSRWSNYKLENYAEAVRFFKQCMAIQSQFQEQAQKNLDVIRSEQESSKEGPEGFEPSTNGLHAEHSVTDVQPLTEVPLREYLCKRLVALNLHRCYRRSITSLLIETAQPRSPVRKLHFVMLYRALQ